MRNTHRTLLLAAAALMACGGGSEAPPEPVEVLPDSLGAVPLDTVLAWSEYAASTQVVQAPEGSGRPLLYEPDRVIGGGDLDPIFYDPYFFDVSGDTLFVSDAGTYRVVAVDTSGSVLWTAGEQGEGPGHFSMMSTVAVSSDRVLALNPLLGRVEIFDRGGEFLRSLAISMPCDAAAMSDGMFVVASRQQPGGHIHVLDPDSGVVRSFGELPVSEDYADIGMMDLMRIAAGPGDTIALFNRYEGRLAVYTPEGDLVSSDTRVYPAIPEPPRMEQEGDMYRFYMFPIAANIFNGPEGLLNAVVVYQSDGSFLSGVSGIDRAPVLVIDRYDWDGTYRDSYCLPDSTIGTTRALSDGRLVARDHGSGTLNIFRPWLQENEGR